MNINKFFDEYLDITTDDDKTMHIENKYAYIINSSYNIPDYNGQINMSIKNNNIYVLKEVYSLENNRLRYSYIKYENVKAYHTIEKSEDGSKEEPIYVIESFDSAKSNIGSIGKIKKINSDKIEQADKLKKDKPLILKLLKRNKKGEVDLESLLNVA